VQILLFAAWIFTAYWIFQHLGGNGGGDLIAGILWVTAAFEIKRGVTTGSWGAYIGDSAEAIDNGDWDFGIAVWNSLDLRERPILFIITVLLTLGIASLLCLAE
jgi:hypothetical protein